MMDKSKYLEFEEMGIRFSPSQLINQVKRGEFGEVAALVGQLAPANRLLWQVTLGRNRATRERERQGRWERVFQVPLVVDGAAKVRRPGIGGARSCSERKHGR